MIGIQAYIRELLWLALPIAATFAALWFRLKGSRKVSLLAVIVFPVILVIQIAILGRQLVAIHSLQHLTPDRVQWISYRHLNFRGRVDVSRIARSLNTTVYYSSRQSDFADHDRFLIHYTDGSDWNLVIGSNRYGSGTILQLSPDGFSSGYAFNPDLLTVLEQLNPEGNR